MDLKTNGELHLVGSILLPLLIVGFMFFTRITATTVFMIVLAVVALAVHGAKAGKVAVVAVIAFFMGFFADLGLNLMSSTSGGVRSRMLQRYFRSVGAVKAAVFAGMLTVWLVLPSYAIWLYLDGVTDGGQSKFLLLPIGFFFGFFIGFGSQPTKALKPLLPFYQVTSGWLENRVWDGVSVVFALLPIMFLDLSVRKAVSGTSAPTDGPTDAPTNPPTDAPTEAPTAPPILNEPEAPAAEVPPNPPGNNDTTSEKQSSSDTTLIAGFSSLAAVVFLAVAYAFTRPRQKTPPPVVPEIQSPELSGNPEILPASDITQNLQEARESLKSVIAERKELLAQGYPSFKFVDDDTGEEKEVLIKGAATEERKKFINEQPLQENGDFVETEGDEEYIFLGNLNDEEDRLRKLISVLRSERANKGRKGTLEKRVLLVATGIRSYLEEKAEGYEEKIADALETIQDQKSRDELLAEIKEKDQKAYDFVMEREASKPKTSRVRFRSRESVRFITPGGTES